MERGGTVTVGGDGIISKALPTPESSEVEDFPKSANLFSTLIISPLFSKIN